MVKHTPGPWEAKRGFVRDANGVSLADAWDYTRPQEECYVNARLMAAAPDMLEALEAFVAEAEQYEERAQTLLSFDGLVQAMAKAKGEIT